MLTAIKGTYSNGRIILHEKPLVEDETEVVVTFLNEGSKHARQGGSMKGEVWMADDFNAPLDDLSEYM